MTTYNVTGTYSHGADGWTRTGQAPGQLIEADTAAAAADIYRETVLVPILVDAGGWAPRGNACAVALNGEPETYSDPLEGVDLPHASRWAMLRGMRREDLYAYASREFRYGLGVQPAIRGRSKMRRRELADALDAREEAARADRQNWAYWAREEA